MSEAAERPEWTPSGADFALPEEAAYGDDWPTTIVVEKWERTERGERRIRDSRTYILDGKAER